MANAIEKMVYCLRTILIRVTVAPISFVFLELSKFALVLVLAFWITIGIFMMWESIMPEAASRLSAAAAAVVANTSGLMPSDEGKDKANESDNYPFVVDLPATNSSNLETHIKDEALLQETATEVKRTSKSETKEDIAKSEGKSSSVLKAVTTVAEEVASAEAVVFKQPSAANTSEAGNSDKPIK